MVDDGTWRSLGIYTHLGLTESRRSRTVRASVAALGIRTRRPFSAVRAEPAWQSDRKAGRYITTLLTGRPYRARIGGRISHQSVDREFHPERRGVA